MEILWRPESTKEELIEPCNMNESLALIKAIPDGDEFNIQFLFLCLTLPEAESERRPSAQTTHAWVHHLTLHRGKTLFTLGSQRVGDN